MIEVQIALLTHKMRITFDMHKYNESNLTPELIRDEVEMVGFQAELLEIIENNQDELMLQKLDSMSELGGLLDKSQELNTYKPAQRSIGGGGGSRNVIK